MSQNQEKCNEIFEEIFMKPSSELKQNRFSQDAQAAPCGDNEGNCASGRCN